MKNTVIKYRPGDVVMVTIITLFSEEGNIKKVPGYVVAYTPSGRIIVRVDDKEYTLEEDMLEPVECPQCISSVGLRKLLSEPEFMEILKRLSDR